VINISKETNHYLILLLAFFVPTSLFFTKLIMVLIIALWLFSGSLKTKLKKISKNQIALASILFFASHILGLLWTSNLDYGLKMISKMIEFLVFLPILLTTLDQEKKSSYITSFLAAIFITICIVNLSFFGFDQLNELIRSFFSERFDGRTPFNSTITQGLTFSLSLYLTIERFLKIIGKEKNIQNNLKIVFLAFFILSLIVAVFNSTSRIGYILVALVIIFQLLQFLRTKHAILSILVSFLLIFYFFYSDSSHFKERVNSAATEMIEYIQSGIYKNTSIGSRLYWAKNSLELIKENFFLGVGTGDFKDEHEKVHMNNHENSMSSHNNPHNMYLLVFANFGIVGLLIFLNIFKQMLQLAKKEKNRKYKRMGYFFILLYFVAMFNDSYLLGHYTQSLFFLFVSIIFSNNKNSTNECIDNYPKI